MKIPTQENAHSFADWGYLGIAKHFSKMLKHEVGVLEDKDTEELHQMRVGMRRLRSAMIGFESALILPIGITQRKVGKIASVLGELRDIDVLLETLENKYKTDLPNSEKDNLNLAITSLKKKRKYAFTQVEKVLHGKQYKKLKQGVQKWLKKPEYQIIGDMNIKEILPDLLLPQVSQFLLDKGWFLGIFLETNKIEIQEYFTQDEVEILLTEEGDILHNLRKEAKKLRYNMELFTHFYGENYQEYLNKIKDIQTVLGDMQDCFVLAEFLENIFATELNNKLPTLINQVKEIRYQKWQEWQALQKYFLERENKNKFREIITNIDISETLIS